MRRRTFIRNSVLTLAALTASRTAAGKSPDSTIKTASVADSVERDNRDNGPSSALIRRVIPASGETIPVIGMGTWLTFDVGPEPKVLAQRAQVLKAFFTAGGGMIDSSPMYGRAEQVVGELMARRGEQNGLFAATKIWSALAATGPEQLRQSLQRWGVAPLDVVHVHNLLRWKSHLNTLRAARDNKLVRYIGVTTSHGRRHGELEKIMRTEALDFVQFSYNIVDREAEKRLLPLAQDRGLAVVINRPFQTSGLFSRFAHLPLPDWSDEIGVKTWAEFFLKFIVSHPAVTCAIPATRQVAHMIENMRAGIGHLPDERQRQRMIGYVRSL
ncbi:MAG: aldo/keto reductase [Gammaproteobacteria bacterium]|nr:aldo/keto reductase [Gammaproteobacteria bacterium]